MNVKKSDPLDFFYYRLTGFVYIYIYIYIYISEKVLYTG